MFKQLIAAVLTSLSLMAHAAVDVNTATVADLDSIKGIGPGTSAKILEARKTAKFKDWADFTSRVSGIGDKRAMKLSEAGLTVNGEAFKGMAKPAAAAKPAKAEMPAKPAAPAKP